jgi:hypothetical protein
MPGFNVSGLGTGPTNLNIPYCTYTWELTSLPQNVIPAHEIYLRDCTEPTFNVLQEKVESATVIYKYAAQADWEDIRASFYDVPREGRALINAIKKWSEAVWTAAGGIKFADKLVDGGGTGSGGYKANTQLRIFNSDESGEYTWALRGSWPSEIKGSDLTYTSSDIKVVDITITYDWALADSSGIGIAPFEDTRRFDP